MTLAYWPLFLAGLLALGVAGWLWWRRAERPAPAAGLVAAHTDQVRRSPAYRALARAALRRAWIALIATALIVTGALVLIGRPSAASAQPDGQHNRDIMLCLDVSGSMHSVDAAMLRGFARIVADMRGERVGLTVWNNSAISIFPLTNDYAYLSRELDLAADRIDDGDLDYLSGTISGRGASLIGDGIVSCLNRFDRSGEQRSRSMILATDNQLSGDPIFTTAEAFAQVREKRVTVYGIADRDSRRVAELRELTQQTGGATYLLTDEGAAHAIVGAIESTEARKLEGVAGARIADTPVLPTLLVVLGVAGLAYSTRKPRRRA